MTDLAQGSRYSTGHNLPVQPTLFIGREKQMEEASTLCLREGVRLVTLTGPGGTGKTRMAVQLAERMLGEFSDGVFFIALAAITDPAFTVATIAHGLGIMEDGNRSLLDSVKGYLRDKQLLLVLDNFEQVLDAGSVVADIMSAAPAVKILVTSRSRLRLRGEHEFPVPPLTLPDSAQPPSPERLVQYEAVRLFIERATALRPDFGLNAENAHAVSEICARLDGLPLAIELAAARIKILSPQAMLSRLQSRLTLLTGGQRDLPVRQQTLGNTIEWSYDLLSEPEQILFKRLSVFSAGCLFEAVEAVCYQAGEPGIDPLDGVSSLVDKNLLRQTELPGGEARFVMLETIQEYGREKLSESGEAAELNMRHALYYLSLAEQADPELRGPRQVEWLRKLELEHDNMRAALRWLQEAGQIETALLLGAALMQFWRMRGHLSEGRAWLEGALAQDSSTPTPARAKALMAYGTLASTQGDYVRGRAALVESLQTFRQVGDKAGILSSLRNLGSDARLQGDYTTAQSAFEEGLAIARELDDRWNIGSLLGDLGIIAQTLGNDKAARLLYEESLSIRRGLTDKRGIAMMLVNIGELARAEGDYAVAHSLYQEALVMARELGDRWGVGMVLHNLGHVAYHWNKYSQALDLFTESLDIFYELRNKRDIAYCLAALAGVFGAQHQPTRAAVLFSAAQSLSNTVSSHLDAADVIEYERNILIAKMQMSPDDWEQAWARGQRMTMDEAVQFALEKDPVPEAAPAPALSITTGPLTEYPGGLSEREVEVLRLVAVGLTDAQVAEKLTISPRTVHRHLSSIYSKLGVTTRTSAARVASEYNLV